MSFFDLTSEYKSAPSTSEPDPFANWTEPGAGPTTANYTAWNTPAPAGTPAPYTPQAPAPPKEPTYNYQYDTWEDESGRLWDRQSGLWYSISDPNNPLVYRPQVGWQSIPQYNDYNSVLNELGQFSANPLVAQPSTRQLTLAEWQQIDNYKTNQRLIEAMPGLQEHDQFQYATREDNINRLMQGGYTRQEAESLPDSVAEDRARLMDRVQYARDQGQGASLSDFLGGLLGPGMQGLGLLNKYVSTPVEETLSQLTPAMLAGLKYVAPGGQQAALAADWLTGYRPEDRLLGGLKDLGSAAKDSGGNPLDFIDIQNKNFEQRPMAEQLAAQLAYDPVNLLGAGLGAKALESGALEGGGLLSSILRAGAKADAGITAAQDALVKPLGMALKPLASEAGSIPASLAAKAALGAGAGGATYALDGGDDSKSRLLKSLAVGLGVAVAPDAVKAGVGKIPTRGKTGLKIVEELASEEPLPLGNAGIQEALGRKEATTATAGKLGEAFSKVPGAKDASAVLDPSVNLERSVHVANQASSAVQAALETRFASTRKPLMEQIDAAFGRFTEDADGHYRPENPPVYTGPETRDIKGTFVDMIENPQDYQFTPLQESTLKLYDLRNNMNVNLSRSQYNTDIGLLKPENPGAGYVPRINANTDLVEQGVTTEARLRNPAISKPRSYETAAERMAADETFLPETDPRRLLEYHDNLIARMAGQQTFKEGVGGLTRTELIEMVRPELVAAKKAAQENLDSLKGMMERRLQKETDLTAAIRKTLSKSRAADERMAPLEARVNLLVENGEYGPELSHLAGQVYELNRQVDALDKLVQGTPKKPGLQSAVVTNDAEIQSLRGRIDTAKKQVEDLIDAYANANPSRDGYVRSAITYRYHTPEVANSIAKVREMGNGSIFDTVTNWMDKAKGTALSSDGSPISIQGVSQWFRDPVNTTKAWVMMILDRGASLDEVARREPEMVSRYVQARGRALGRVTDEFDPTHSLIASIPKGVGKGFTELENKMFGAIQRVDYETWKSTRNMLAKINPDMPADVIDHEAANAISKTNPSLNQVERGVSPARAKLERAAFTSVSFMASPVLVTKDAASAAIKLAMGQRPRGREQVALAHLLTMNATIFGLSAASAAATADSRNLSIEDAVKRVFNPGRKDFMSLYLPGGQRIPLGGPYRSFFKAMAPMDADGNLRAPRLLDWAKSRIAPLPSAALEAYQNKDFYGDKIRSGNDFKQLIDTGYYLVEQGLAPLSVGSALEAARKGGSATDVLSNAAGQLLGNAPQPETPTDRLDTIARAWPENQGRDFYKSPPEVQTAIKEGHPDLWKEAVESGSEERKAAYKKEQELVGQQLASDNLLKSNDITAADWRDARSKRYDELRNTKAGIYALTDSQIKADPRLDGYFTALKNATGPDGSVDWDRIEAYTQHLSTEDRQFIEDNTGLGLRTEKTKEYKSDMKTINDAGYWGLDDDLWTRFARQYEIPNTTDPQQYWTDMRKSLISMAEQKLTEKYGGESWRTNSPNAAVELGDIAFNKAKGKYDDALSELRKKWRAEHPKEAQILAKWQLGGTGQEETLGRIAEANR